MSAERARRGLVLEQLHKQYRRQPVLRGLDLWARPGEVTALIGPNGAGKSTALQAAAGLVPLDGGRVWVDGVDASADPVGARRRLGYAPQELSLSPFLTGEEFLAFVAEVRGLAAGDAEAQAETLLRRFSLTAAKDRLTREYSEGMARKLSIAAAALGAPPVLVLDETLNGLDPQSSAEASRLLRERAEAGAAVLLTTHILPLASELADRVVLLHDGEVALELDRAALAEARERRRSLDTIYLEAVGGQAASSSAPIRSSS